MLRELLRPVIEERALAQVPRRLSRRVALLQAEMHCFCHVVAPMESLLTLQRADNEALQLPPLLLTGPPGVGKTLFAHRLAAHISYGVMHVEPSTAGWLLSGIDLRWSNGSPDIVFDALVHCLYANLINVVDELDKVSSDLKCPQANCLYGLVEPDMARSFQEEACRALPLDAINYHPQC